MTCANNRNHVCHAGPTYMSDLGLLGPKMVHRRHISFLDRRKRYYCASYIRGYGYR